MLIHKLAQNIGSAWFFQQHLPDFFLTGYVQNYFFLGSTLILPLILLGTIAVIMALIATLIHLHPITRTHWTITWHAKPQTYFLWLVIIVSFVPAVFLHLDNRPQYFMSAAAACYLLVAAGIVSIIRKTRLWVYILSSIVALLIVSTINIVRATPIFNTDKIAHTIEQHEKSGDIVLVHGFMNKLPFDRYYHGTLPVYGFYPLNDTSDQNIRYIIHNWNPIITLDNVHKLNILTSHAKRIFLVYYVTGSIYDEELVKNWLYFHNWRIVETYTFPGPIDLPLFVLERTDAGKKPYSQ